MTPKILRSYYRNGQLYQVAPLRDGIQHGVTHCWYRNGQLADEIPYRNGLVHGVRRQWDENGKLLGEFRLIHGTGWHRYLGRNGRLHSEFFTLDGRFCGRSRSWLDDGTLISDRLYLDYVEVSASQYRKAAVLDKRLPRLRGRYRKTDVQALRRGFELLIAHRLKQSPIEAREWLAAKEGKRRSLGGFRIARNAAKSKAGQFIAELYEAGAEEVLVPDIYFNKRGDQYGDCLLVKVPRDKTKRAALWRFCARSKTPIPLCA